MAAQLAGGFAGAMDPFVGCGLAVTIDVTAAGSPVTPEIVPPALGVQANRYADPQIKKPNPWLWQLSNWFILPSE